MYNVFFKKKSSLKFFPKTFIKKGDKQRFVAVGTGKGELWSRALSRRMPTGI